MSTVEKATPTTARIEAPPTLGHRAQQLRDVRVPFALPIAVAASASTGLLLLYASRRLSFRLDEWVFILRRYHPTAHALLSGHNGHWSTLPVLVYEGLLHTVGLRSYLPYMAILELLHSGAALLLFILVRRRAGDVLAFIALLLFLTLGAGSGNLFWAFQMSFVGSVFFGLLGMLLIDRDTFTWFRAIGVSLSLLASLMFSGIGLIFLAMIGIELLLSRHRRLLVALAPPVLAYAWWYETWGRFVGPRDRPLRLDAAGLERVARFIRVGVFWAVGRTYGIPDDWGRQLTAVVVAGLIVATAAIAVAGWVAARRVDGRSVGALVGFLLLYGLTGLVRARLGIEGALASRYVYIAALFLLLVITVPLGQLPGRVWIQASVVMVALALAFQNAQSFRAPYQSGVRRKQLQAAEFQAVLYFRHAPDFNGVNFDPLIPAMDAASLFRLIDQLGLRVSPLDLAEAERHPQPNQLQGINAATVRLFRRRLRVLPGPERGGTTGPCRSVQGSTTQEVPSAGTVVMGSRSGGRFRVYLWFIGGPVNEQRATIRVVLAPSSSVRLQLPDLGKPEPWHLTIVGPPGADLQLCAPA